MVEEYDQSEVIVKNLNGQWLGILLRGRFDLELRSKFIT